MTNFKVLTSKVLVFIISVVFLKLTNAARIFGAFTIPSISHQVVYRALMEELALRGHEIVVMTTDPVNYREKQFENITEIDVHDFSYKAWRDRANFANERMKDQSPMSVFDLFCGIMIPVSEKQLEHPDIVKLMANRNETFDLCIVEGTLRLFTAFKDRFKCPLILINSFPGLVTNFEITGSPTHPVHYFDMLNPYHPNEMDIWKKLKLLKQRLEYIYYQDFKYNSEFQEIAKRHFGADVRRLEDIEAETDMVFLNFHPVISGIRPLPPTIVQMGSMHIRPPKPLPKDLQKIMDGAKNGVIYFSLGSNVRSCDLPQGILNEILRVLKSLSYTILWKFEAENLPNKPPNVFISKWYPQQSILAHPNTKLFITQGGQQSMEESIHYGVPMITIPFMADQNGNAARVLYLGIGKRLFIEAITGEMLKTTIMEIMTNNSYRDNVNKLRELIYDQPQTARERAVWWAEYVIRHKGAKHLRSPTAGMNFLEYYMIFELIYILSVILPVIIIVIYAIRKIYHKLNFNYKLKQS